MIRSPFIAAFLLLVASPTIAATEDPLPAWMAGDWQQVDGDRWTEEHWTAPRAGIMLGMGRSGRGEKLAEWEAIRIEVSPDGRTIFTAAPQGGTPVAFPRIGGGPQEIVFANPTHDYPQRIRYWRDGSALMAEISLSDGSKARRWRYDRIAR